MRMFLSFDSAIKAGLKLCGRVARLPREDSGVKNTRAERKN
jgi:hypothetical protein